jgi:cell wall-associated NlpC family hydrolase
MLVSTLLVVTVTAPSQAQTGDVPDPGSRPTPDGQLPLPDGSTTRPAAPRTTVIGPLAAEIAATEIELETASQQLQLIEPQLAPAGTAAEFAEQEWLIKSEALEGAERKLDELVGESYKGAAALPRELFIPQLPGLNAHAPAVPVDAPIGAEAAAREYVKARDEAQVAAEQLDLAQNAEQTLEEQAEQLEDTIEKLTDELEDLRDRNAELLVEQERDREARDQENADDYLDLQPVNGYEAHPRAVKAVKFALGELGKPYLWGAEGPDRYDCSGLMWAAYRSVGETLPRVAADQYFGTRDMLVTRSAAVAQRGLLPGDLVFFSSGPSWQSIGHVGMYIGNGQMVHSPNSRSVVKVSPVWWSRFFAATRVVEAVPTDEPGGGHTPTPGPSPTPPGSGVRPTTPPPSNTPPTTTPPTTAPPTTNPPTTPPPTTTTVPDLTGMTAAEAQNAIGAADLVADTGDPVVDGSCTPGAVIGQTPAPGTEVEVGSQVTFQICQAPPETPASEDPPASDAPASESPASSSTPSPVPG